MEWWAAGLVLYSFAAPSSIMGVAFTFSHAGILGGVLGCLVVMGAGAAGAILLTDLAASPGARMLSDIGRFALGPIGERLGLALQMLNFLLYLPVALLTTAQALQGALQPSGTSCTNYFVFAVALFCFASTQVRDLAHSTALAVVALVASLSIAVLQVMIVASHPAVDVEPVQWIGNAHAGTIDGSVRLALSLTTCAWSYVPSLLAVELAHTIRRPQDLRLAILLSFFLSATIFIAVGLPVAAHWGADIEDPVSLFRAWPKHSASARVLSALLCLANTVSYCLDSVPFCRW